MNALRNVYSTLVRRNLDPSAVMYPMVPSHRIVYACQSVNPYRDPLKSDARFKRVDWFVAAN